MMTTFDRAWDIAKKDDDYSKFGEKFAARMKEIKEGGRGLPEGTKFSDLRSTSIEEPFMGSGGGMRFRRESGKFSNDYEPIYSGAGAEKDTRPPMPKGVPIDILDLPNYRPDPGEEDNQRILARIMGAKNYDDAVDMIDQMERERMEAETAKRQGHVNIPDSLIRRVRDDPTPKDD